MWTEIKKLPYLLMMQDEKLFRGGITFTKFSNERINSIVQAIAGCKVCLVYIKRALFPNKQVKLKGFWSSSSLSNRAWLWSSFIICTEIGPSFGKWTLWICRWFSSVLELFLAKSRKFFAKSTDFRTNFLINDSKVLSFCTQKSIILWKMPKV